MNWKLLTKIIVDVAMTLCLLLLMPYSLLGETVHEWIGMAMLVLFLGHHFLNRKWIVSITKGKYSIYRGIQATLAGIMLLLMIGSMTSGIVISNHIFHITKTFAVSEYARQIHMFCAYWGFMVMAVHLGIHWNIVVVMMGRLFATRSVARQWTARGTTILMAVYGVYAFQKRQFWDYLFLKTHFLFIDAADTIVWFMIDYLAVMILVVCISYYVQKFSMLRRQRSL